MGLRYITTDEEREFVKLRELRAELIKYANLLKTVESAIEAILEGEYENKNIYSR